MARLLFAYRGSMNTFNLSSNLFFVGYGRKPVNGKVVKGKKKEAFFSQTDSLAHVGAYSSTPEGHVESQRQWRRRKGEKGAVGGRGAEGCVRKGEIQSEC